MKRAGLILTTALGALLAAGTTAFAAARANAPITEPIGRVIAHGPRAHADDAERLQFAGNSSSNSSSNSSRNSSSNRSSNSSSNRSSNSSSNRSSNASSNSSSNSSDDDGWRRGRDDDDDRRGRRGRDRDDDRYDD
jgi:hypothetical protein